MAEGTAHLGRRLREIRLWREMSLKAVAELAGLSEGYLSRIERGLKPVERRATQEALAGALRVAPSELMGTPLLLQGASEEHAAVTVLRTALAELELGEPVEVPAPPWENIAARLGRFDALRLGGDYTAQAEMLPDLLRDLHATLAQEQHRRDALAGLVSCYSAAQFAARNLGAIDLAQVAAHHVHDTTSALSGPEWYSLAGWSRAQAISPTARSRGYAVAVAGALAVQDELDQPRVAEVAGMLHLTAALAATTTGRLDTGRDHLALAADIASRPGVGGSGPGFAHLSFGSGNVEIWRTMLEVEAGEGGRAVQIAKAVNPSILPSSATRRASWWIDIGRGLAMERGTRGQAIRAFLTAEGIAPQRVRSSPWVRETVTGLLPTARRDAAGRELRGLAYRIGLAG